MRRGICFQTLRNINQVPFLYKFKFIMCCIFGYKSRKYKNIQYFEDRGRRHWATGHIDEVTTEYYIQAIRIQTGYF